jgi:hypothetical protein
MLGRFTIFIATLGILLSVAAGYPQAYAGEGFFEKIGNGPRNVVVGIIEHPQRIFPPCWGSDRCDNPSETTATAQRPYYSVSFRVDCVDAVTGADRADNTVTVTSPVSIDDARNTVMQSYQTTDLCQANGDRSRRMVPGSGRWL